MKFGKIVVWPLFLFWSVAALAMLVIVALHPLDRQWWVTFAVCLGGAALYFPFPGAARVRKTITIKRTSGAVYDFLSRPANLHIWNPRVGVAQPAEIPVEVGQEWTYSPGRWWFLTAPSSLRHAFSKVDPPHALEITATGRGLRAMYAYILRDVGPETEVTVDATIFGVPAPMAWLTSATATFYPSRDLGRLKRALEIGPATKDPSPSH